MERLPSMLSAYKSSLMLTIVTLISFFHLFQTLSWQIFWVSHEYFFPHCISSSPTPDPKTVWSLKIRMLILKWFVIIKLYVGESVQAFKIR